MDGIKLELVEKKEGLKIVPSNIFSIKNKYDKYMYRPAVL